MCWILVSVQVFTSQADPVGYLPSHKDKRLFGESSRKSTVTQTCKQQQSVFFSSDVQFNFTRSGPSPPVVVPQNSWCVCFWCKQEVKKFFIPVNNVNTPVCRRDDGLQHWQKRSRAFLENLFYVNQDVIFLLKDKVMLKDAHPLCMYRTVSMLIRGALGVPVSFLSVQVFAFSVWDFSRSVCVHFTFFCSFQVLRTPGRSRWTRWEERFWFCWIYNSKLLEFSMKIQRKVPNFCNQQPNRSSRAVFTPTAVFCCDRITSFSLKLPFMEFSVMPQ